MKNRLFSKLLDLYSSHRQKVPREDFFTEVLAGVLQSDQQLLNDYAHEVLKLPEDQFSLVTQARYSDSIIDMVFESRNCLCFVENKVDASEGQKQLSKYAKLLQDHASAKEVCSLRYCTWYHDQKSPEDYYPSLPESFYQFRWPAIYAFFEQYQSNNSMVAAFLVLLEEYRMNKLPDLTGEDLIAMRQIGSTILKMDECFNLVKPVFIQMFGEPYERNYARLKEIPDWGRYAMYRREIIKGLQDSQISISFDFEVENAPALCVECSCPGPSHSIFKQAIAEGNLENIKTDNLGELDYYTAWFEKPLSDFMDSPNRIKDITNWFTDKMKKLEEFMRQDKRMKWNLPKKTQSSTKL